MGVRYFQNLRNCLDILGGFLWWNFKEDFFGEDFLEGFFWKEFFGRNYLVEINKELMFLSSFWST